jgi:ribonuclease HI
MRMLNHAGYRNSSGEVDCNDETYLASPLVHKPIAAAGSALRGTDSHGSPLALDHKSQPPAMSVSAPHFLLYAEAAQAPDCAVSSGGRWRFVLQQPGGQTALEAADEEPEAGPDRLELLAIVRGLEALEAPARVTLVTGSRHIRRGLEAGLAQWRDNGWQWERYGRMTPVKNSDLWRRLDRLTDIHTVECRPARQAPADDLATPSVRQPAKRARSFRVDAAHGGRKHEIRNPKPETNPKSKRRKVSNKGRFGHLYFLISNSFRASNFVLRAFAFGKSSVRKRTRT